MQLGSVIVTTADKGRMMRFYHDVMGIPFNAQGKLESRGVIIHPALHDAITGPPLEPYRTMLTFDVADIQQTTRELQAKGVSFVRLPEQEWWGGWIATFCDPDGNYLQLLQPADVRDEGSDQQG